MRLRTLGAAVAAVLAVGGLAGCRTNIGTAAMIDGHRVTESDVNDYITPKAQPVSLQTSSGSTVKESPRSFVIRQLIYDRLFRELLAKTPQGAPTDAQLDARLHKDLAGKTNTQAAAALGVKGYSADFDTVVVRVRELEIALNNLNQQGVDLNALVKKLHVPVSVSARYGSWNGKTLSFDGSPAVPGYLTVQPAG